MPDAGVATAADLGLDRTAPTRDSTHGEVSLASDPLKPPGDAPPIAPTRRRSIALLASLFVFFFAAYVFSASADYFSTGDTTIRIELAENILGRWSVDLHGWKLQIPNHYKKENLDPRIDHGRQGKVYSTYLLGQPLLIIPFDKIGSIIAVYYHWPYGPALLFIDRMVGPLVGALEVLMFFVFAVRLGYSRRRALLLTLICGFASSVWPDEQSVLEHTLVGLSFLVAMYGAFRYRDQRARPWLLIFSGIGIGGAVITRYQDAFLGLLAIGLYLLLPGGPGAGWVERARRCVLVGIGVLPFLILDIWYNWVRYGKLFDSGHHETVFGYAIWKGALGLTVSPGKGLLWYCPILFLLAIAGPRFARRFGALSLAIAFLFAAFVLLYGYVTYWHGDPAWGPRYLYPTVALLVLPLGELLRWRGRHRRAVWAVTAAIVLVSFGIQFAAVSVSPWRTWYRVIAYEEGQGHPWNWIASRYRYFWNVHESPLNFQIHGVYQLTYDGIRRSDKYAIVPPDEDPTLDGLAVNYAINQWNFWWKSDEFDWWMGRDKILAGVTILIAIMVASGTYVVAETSGLFLRSDEDIGNQEVPEEA
jgi:hypothetical protein